MANGVNTADDRIFSYLESADPDLTFVADERIFSEEIQLPTEESEKSWIAFNKRLGSLPNDKKQQLKNLWIEGGRPIINIRKKGETAKKGSSKESINRARYSPHFVDIEADPRLHRDDLYIFEHKLLGDFMEEISHGRQYALKRGESRKEWIARRKEIYEKVDREKVQFGKEQYGGTGTKGEWKDKQWFPYEGQDPQPSRQYTEFDPETRLGKEGQKPTFEFEAHEIIDDSLWNDWKKRFGPAWGEMGDSTNYFRKLIDQD
jgi:hypothetical protein